ncbi:MAG: H+-translocating transhydrogenase subunit alpha [Thermoleophilales bacterium]|nr:H+-translocating transhydrogenase subunit alpha [Thermoleophilales bacterium]
MKVGIPNESASGENRVATTPDVIKRLSNKGVDFVVESGAGAGASIPDEQFADAGATIATDPSEVWGADVVAKVRAPSTEEIARLRQGGVLIGFLAPLTSPETTRALADAKVTAFAMEAIPRITRAQSMDALSSQATVAGYRAVLIAGLDMGRFFPMLTTAAGTIKPASVLVLGAGVAGLQAIATARRLGAQVTAFDVRSAVKEQVQSLGAKFLELDLDADAEGTGGYAKALDEDAQRRQQEQLAKAAGRFDVVITTALIPGKPAPKLLIEDAVRNMKPGSVIVDLAGEAGGNTEITEPGQTIVRHDVTIASPLNLPSDMPDHASQLYARNIMSLLELMAGDEGALALDWDDEIIKGAAITHDGEIVHDGAKQAVGAGA